MDRDDNIYRQAIDELDLTLLAQLCGNIAHNRAANPNQRDAAHALRVEWVKLELDSHGNTQAEKESLKKRMAEFLTGVPAWITNEIN